MTNLANVDGYAPEVVTVDAWPLEVQPALHCPRCGTFTRRGYGGEGPFDSKPCPACWRDMRISGEIPCEWGDRCGDYVRGDESGNLCCHNCGKVIAYHEGPSHA
jgi:hypothetical protein